MKYINDLFARIKQRHTKLRVCKNIDICINFMYVHDTRKSLQVCGRWFRIFTLE
jgi:hypothetical protein